MNEQIKQLSLQASDSIPDDVSAEHAMYLFQKKFAELIVNECGQYLMRDEFIGRSDLDWSMVLNEHFGYNSSTLTERSLRCGSDRSSRA